MATITWTNGNTTNLWNDAGNWDAGVPTGSDDAVFDATSTDDCTCNVAIDVLSLSVASGYSGKLDFADSGYTHLIGVGGALFVGTGEIDCGDSHITCSGNFDNDSQTTWAYGTSEVEMDTDGTTMSVHQVRLFYNLHFSASGTVSLYGTACDVRHTITIDAATTVELVTSLLRAASGVTKTLVLNGILSISASESFSYIASGGTRSINIGANGKITGNGQVILRDVVITNNNVGISWDIAQTFCRASSSIGEGTYGGSWVCTSEYGTRTLTIGNAAGEVVEFSDVVTFDQDVSSGTYTVDASTHNSKLIFNDDVNISVSGGGTGVVVWSESNATDAITFDGITVIDNSAGIGTLGDVTIAGGAEINLDSDVTTDNLTVEQNATVGAVGGTDTFVVEGNFVINGTSGNTVSWTDADLDVTGTAVASWTNVTNSDASAGTEIDATDNCNDISGNTNWNFGQTVDCGLGTVSVSGYNPEIEAGTTIDCGLGTVSVSGYNPEIEAGTTIDCGLGIVSISGYNPEIEAGTTIDCGLGIVSISGYNPEIETDTTIDCGLGTVSISGYNLEIEVGLDQQISFAYYGTVLEATEYFSLGLREQAWMEADVEDRPKALLAASVIIDALNYKGYKSTVFTLLEGSPNASDEEIREAEADQDLEFPRGADSVVPEIIRRVTYEIAYELLDGKNPEIELENLGVISQSYAAVRTSYSRNQVPIEHIINGIPSPQAWRWLKPFLREDDAIVTTRIS